MGVAIDEKGVSFMNESTDLGSKTSDLQKCPNTFVPDCRMPICNQIKYF